MQKLVDGIHHFQSNIFRSQREMFARLANGQNPEALFITCSDSRINPNLITNTAPGDLFIIRNAGNIIPPYGASNGGEAATIEFAVVGLGVKDVIICGHSDCGAMKGLLDPSTLKGMRAMQDWLSHAEATRWVVREKYQDLAAEAMLSVTIQENVLIQLENLRTHPSVAAGLSNESLKLHAWVYRIETGDVFTFDPSLGQFAPLAEVMARPVAPRPRRHVVHGI
jgi:carbonic anhydrase